MSVPTASPSLSFDDDADDVLDIKSTVVNLDWTDIGIVSAAYGVIGVVFLLVFEYQRRQRSSRALVYVPRAQWEKGIAARSGGRYSPLARPSRSELRTLDWFWSVLFETDDATILRHVGLEMYMFLRFVRLGFRLCLFGTVIVAPICCSVYGTTGSNGNGNEYAWYRFTLANVDPDSNAGRLVVPALFMSLVTFHALLAFSSECLAYVELRQDFFTEAPTNADRAVAEQQLRSVMLERVPSHLRTGHLLLQHWERLLPGRVHSATVALDAPELQKIDAERELTALHLERMQLREARTGKEPKVGDDDTFCDHPCGFGGSSGEDGDEAKGKLAIPVALRRLERLNEAHRALRAAAFAKRASQLADETAEAVARAEAADSNETEAFDSEEGSGETKSVMSEPSLSERFVQSLSQTKAGVLKRDQSAGSALGATGLRRVAGGVWSGLVQAAELARFATVGHRRSSTAFVTFKDVTAAHMARQMQLAPRPLGVSCYPLAPDPRDVIWENVAETEDSHETRTLVGSFLVGMLALYWSIYVAFCYAITSYSNLLALGLIPDRDDLSTSSKAVLALVLALAPIALIAGALSLAPLLLEKLAVLYERTKLHSRVQLSVLSRNFLLQCINLWLTVVTGSIIDVLKSLTSDPSKVLELVAFALPQVSVYFVELILVYALVGLPWELSRALALLRARAARLAAGGALTVRDRGSLQFLQPSFCYGQVYTTQVMVALFALLFSTIAPLVYPFALLYFGLAFVVYGNNAMHVYVPKFEQGGVFFFPVLYRLLAGLMGAQLTLAIYLSILEAWEAALIVAVLPVLTYAFQGYVEKRFERVCKHASLELVLAKDAQLQRDRAQTETVLQGLDPELYRQPALLDADVAPNSLAASLQAELAVQDDDDDARTSPLLANPQFTYS